MEAFCTTEWELMLPSCLLQAAFSLASDNCPMLLTGETNMKYIGFRFESFWPAVRGFQEKWHKFGADCSLQPA